MANNIKGITLVIGGDMTQLDKELNGVNKSIKWTQRELREVERLLKLDPKNTELVAQKQILLKNAVSETKEKLDVLKTAEKQVQEQVQNGKATEEQYRAIQREIIATEQTLKKLEEQTKTSNITFEKVGDALVKVGEKSTALGKKMLPITAGITAIGGAGIAAAMELDNGYDTIITKTGATGEALEELTAVADNIFSNMPTSMDNAGTAVGEINTRFQKTGEELEKLSKQFIQFAEINDVDLNNSIGATDKIMEQWNIEVKETGNLLGLITKKGQDTGISVDTLMQSVQQNGATFKEMGLNLTQSIDLLAQFEANGVNAEIAIAGLKKSVKNYTDEGKSTDEALKLTIENIKNASSETEALSMAQEIFGTKGAAEMSNAIREGRIDLESLSKSMNEYGNVVNDTFEATQDPWDEATIAMNNIKLAGADLGASLLTTVQPTITKVVDKVKEFTTWFGNLDDKTKQIIIKTGLLVAAIGPALLIFGKMSTGISGIIKTVTGLSTKLGGMSGILAVITGPIGIAIAAITALATGFLYLYKTNDAFKEKVNTAMEQVSASFSQMWQKVQPLIESLKIAFKNLMTTLQPIFEFIITYIGAIANGVINAVAPIIAAITNVVSFISNIIKALVALLNGDFESFFTYIQMAFQNIIDFIKNMLQAAINFIIGFFEGFGINIQLVCSNIWNGICAIFGSIGQWFGARWTEIQTALVSIPEWFRTQFDNAWSNIQNAFANVISFFSGLWETIKGCFANIGTNIGTAVGDAFKTAINGCLSTIEGIVNKFIGMINGVIGIINEIPGVSLGTINELSLPRLAKGGVLREGTAMVAEAGPELLSMVNGKAVVTPLTGSARNHAADTLAQGGGGYSQTINVSSPRPLSAYEVARQTRIMTRSMILATQRG